MLTVVANTISPLSSISHITDTSMQHKRDSIFNTSGQPSKSRNESGAPACDQDGPSTSYIYPYSRLGFGEGTAHLPPDDEKSSKHRKSSKDCCKLFVGNLILSITEVELKAYFIQFGHVLNIHINSKKNMSEKVPNFGFVMFDNSESVKNAVNSQPIADLERRKRQ
ncbi:hypothetical protein TNCT_587331 [Trichonephila clavata]|uniref:RRM domain-containing protein n=1 Tax=Trichonephila clavata TaxID=2740835 RepID=A0A8X6FAR1_TRICU|nr:hypothetical protein TNCT_587331 [Trichonephila clavata]